MGMWLGVSTSVYAVQFFIPTIAKELDYTSAASQVHSIPIFLSAVACSVAVARLADRLGHRYAFIVFGILVTVPGYFILMVRENIPTGVRYMACFLVTCGGFMAQPVAPV
jgi:MFS family permease